MLLGLLYRIIILYCSQWFSVFCYGKYNPMTETTWWSWNSVSEKKKHNKTENQRFFFKDITVQNFGRRDNGYPRDSCIFFDHLGPHYWYYLELLIIHSVIIFVIHLIIYSNNSLVDKFLFCIINMSLDN